MRAGLLFRKSARTLLFPCYHPFRLVNPSGSGR